MGRYPQISPGEEVFPEMQGYRMACCDCGLVHTLDFRVVKVTGVSGDGVFSTTDPDDADSLRIVLTADRDDTETERIRTLKAVTPAANGEQTVATDAQVNELREAASAALPFLQDEANRYEDDGSNEPLETLRRLQAAIEAAA